MANTPLTTGIQPAQLHTMGNAGPPPGSFPPMSMQFQPVGPPSQQPFAQATPQQYPLGGHLNMGMLPPPPPPVQYHQAAQTSLQHPPSRSQPPSLQQPPQPPSQIPVFSGHGQSQEPPVPPPDFHPNGHVMSSSSQPHIHNSLASSSGGPRFSHVSYDLPSSSDGQQQTNVGSTATQTDPPSYSVGHPWFTIGNQQLQSFLPSQQVAEQRSGSQVWFLGGTQNVKPVTPSHQNDGKSAVGQQWHLNGSQNESSGIGSQPTAGQTVINIKNTLNDQAKRNASDWIEHTSPLGKKYYYNKKTKISSWEKPLELMTLTERADASTDWKEHTTSEGRRFYFNKVTKRSRWAIPDEVKLAREQVGLASSDVNPIANYGDPASAVLSISGAEASSSNGNAVSLSARETVPSPVSAGATNTELLATSGSSSIQEVAAATAVMSTPLRTSEQDAGPSYKETLQGSLEEAKKGAEAPGNRDVCTPELKNVEHGPSVYENKEEAKIAFKALLETANVGSDWNWDQAMRVIINDRRYGALRTLGERKQAFNEFVGLKKKKEAEEKRAKQRKTKEDFKIMLQECKDLASSMRWSKAVSVFEKDERFQALERIKDREDLFEDYLEELKKKERAKALEEHKRHKTEYLEFLKSCNFIKANSQWRKVQHHLEADERCSRLEKIERLEIFQEYLRDLEMEEEEQRKLRMEGMRKTERKNRDEFRKLLEEHAAHGFLTIKSNWRDYEMQVKETPAYISVSSNTSGPTAEHLFEDVIDDLEKQYLEDKERTEEAIMNQKIALSLASTLEDFKNALSKEINLKSISDANVKLIFNELLEVTKEREEKEAKRRKRLAKDVYELLFNSNEVTSSSKWEDCKTFVEERFIGEEIFFHDIFDTVIMELREKEKRKERKKKEDQRQREKRDRKSKDRHRKDRERRKMDEAGSEGSKSSSFEEEKRSRDKSKMCRRQDADSFDPTSLDDDEKAHSRLHRHSKQKGSIFMEGDSESEFKRQKRDHHPVFVEDQKAEEGEVQ